MKMTSRAETTGTGSHIGMRADGSAQFRAIAFYLPQFHPIRENDEWWGPGFTEWTNVAKARSLFPGHHQPNLPADLGFYDLRLAESREAQAELARKAGIEGFCYWHYWFAGRRILERPFAEVLAQGKPDFPFCLAWANETWQGIWHGCERRVLIEQTYPDLADIDAHFHSLLPAFRDRRYIRVNGRPLFVIYQPLHLPSPEQLISRWQELAVSNGLPGLHFVAHLLPSQFHYPLAAHGYEAGIAAQSVKVFRARFSEVIKRTYNKYGFKAAASAFYRLSKLRLGHRLFKWPASIYAYEDISLFINMDEALPNNLYPVVLPNWDNSPRAGKKGVVISDSTPEKYRLHLRAVLDSISHRGMDDRIVFIKSWNEWAEGNYLEPDRRFGHAYLDVTKEELSRHSL
jgi:lipopolysaccharide biosynthesis protein